MAATRRDITDTLDSIGWHYVIDEENDHVYTNCRSASYSLNGGIPALRIVLHTIENGRVLVIIMPEVRNVSHLNPVRRLLLHDILNDSLNLTNTVKCYIDKTSGYLRLCVDVPLEYADFHASILLKAIQNLLYFVDVFIEEIDDVLSMPMEIDVPENDEIIIMTRTEMLTAFERYRHELDTAI